MRRDFTIGAIGGFRKDYTEPTLCPRCLCALPNGYPGALSRADNKTEVCSACGMDEALRGVIPTTRWPFIEFGENLH